MDERKMSIDKLLIALSLGLVMASCSKMPPIDTTPKKLVCDGVVKLESKEGQRMTYSFGSYFIVSGKRDFADVFGTYTPDERAACQIKDIQQ